MKKTLIIIGIVLGVLLLMGTIVISSAVGIYNGLQTSEERVKQTLGDVESTYQRRTDLIPQLVEVVKGYQIHENSTLVQVTEARAKINQINITSSMMKDPKAMQKFQSAQGDLSTALSRLMVVVEKYPELKANENFRDLQTQIEGTENRINVARERYNGAVRDFNSSARVFPGNIINGAFAHLEMKVPFKADEGAKTAPKFTFK
jgi:LemA protein